MWQHVCDGKYVFKLKQSMNKYIRKAMIERNPNEGQWEDRMQWSLGVGQRRKTFLNRYI